MTHEKIDLSTCRGCDNIETRLNIELLRISCDTAKVDPYRTVVSISYLVNLLNAVEKYLYRFDETVIVAGKMKKEGLDTTGLFKKIQGLQAELSMYAALARAKLKNSKEPEVLRGLQLDMDKEREG